MKLNADFSPRVAVRFNETAWVASPMPGVERKMLDRIGDEVARATSIVRYAPGSAFSPHTHDGGEEYLVLEGTFCDEHGAFPVGTYVRNPPTSRHTPSAPDGAVILVKLHQFDLADRLQKRVDVSAREPVQILHEDRFEKVRIENWQAGDSVVLDAAGGMEIFVIRGRFSQDAEVFGKWDWLRMPTGSTAQVTAGAEGAQVWIKSGHLSRAPAG